MSDKAEALAYMTFNYSDIEYRKMAYLINQAERAKVFTRLVVMLLEHNVDDVRLKNVLHPFYDYQKAFSPEMLELC